MKNSSKLIALFLGAALSLTACSAPKIQTPESQTDVTEATVANTEETTVVTTLSVERTDDGYVVAKSDEYRDFCTKHLPEYTNEWVAEEGLYIETSTEGIICSVNIARNYDTEPTAEELAEKQTEFMKSHYGESLLEIREPDYYDIGGKTLYGIDYIYEAYGEAIRFLRLYEMKPGSGYVMYTCKYVVDSEYVLPTLQALETAVLYYRDGRNFYDGDQSQQPQQTQQPQQSQQPSGSINNGNFRIVPSISKTIEYDTYSDGWATIDYPKGWVIKSCTYDGTTSFYEIHAYDPEVPDRQFYFAPYSTWFSDKTAHDNLCSIFGNSALFGGYPYLLGGTQPVQEMFMNFNCIIDSYYGANMDFSPMYDWTETEHFGYSPLGAELIRGRYNNGSGEEIDGLFSGERTQPLYMNGFEYPGGFNTPMFFSAPAGEFNEWEPILSHCIDSLRLTDAFIDTFYSEQNATMAASRIYSDIANDISDMITSSWNARQTTYDIISAKQSDAILGYDRIYNTDTNEVYRIEVGLFDSYSGTDYKTIDDSMYSVPVSGYIYAD